jgi:catechol 2,3-dioxygenase-like lactoylglutathione lyase family enzyme
MSRCGGGAGVCAPERFAKENSRRFLKISAHRDDDFPIAMNSRVARIDHIQIAAPQGCEPVARDFYGSVLGMTEIEKPPVLRVRGGCWFECGSQQLHIGVERDFQPARKAHPAFAVPDLDELRKILKARGVKVVEDDNLQGARRFYAEDPWGNRLEFVEALA